MIGRHRAYPAQPWRLEVRSHRPRGSVNAPFVAMGTALIAWAFVVIYLLHPW